MFRFLHTADLHLDAPFAGLSEYEGAPIERLRSATRQAFENLIRLAVRERVDFVVIAGDLFDGRWTNMQTGLWTANQFRELDRAGIPVYMIRGNHDALSEVPKSISWPPNVHEFSVDRAETLRHPRLPVVLHGQGFSSRDVREDVAARYPEPVADAFNIGLLHTSLSGDARHDTYAPTSEQTLVSRGYQYWALGHIHQRREVRENPHIAYSGCTQGRHIHEQGAKGCLLVQVDGARVTSAFYPLDTLRWRQLDVDLTGCDEPEEAFDEVSQQLQTAVQDAEGRYLAVRVTLIGMTACHEQFVDPARAEELLAEIRNRGNHVGNLWVEQLKVETLPKANLEQLKQGDDFLGELLRDLDSLRGTTDENDLLALAEVLAPLRAKAGPELREAGIDLASSEQVRHWLLQAEGLLLTRLMQDQQSA